MKMFAAIFVCGCFLIPSQVSSQQYPFITYTTKDGLISNRVRKMFQDSSGRLFFLTYNGLSIYDAKRFTNYSTEDGFPNELINDVMQMDNDSFWVATNAPSMNCLVNGKVKTVETADGYCPVVNQLYRNKEGRLFAAADQGLFIYESNRFSRLRFINNGADVGILIRRIEAITNELMLVQVDAGPVNKTATLFLYNYKLQKVVSAGRAINFCCAPKNNYWVITGKGLRMLDISALKQNKLELQPLPGLYKSIASWVTNYAFFDRDENCWLVSPDNFLAKCDPKGNLVVFSSEKRLTQQEPNETFQDNEGILWFNFLQNGVSKLTTPDVFLCGEVFGMHHISAMNYAHSKLILYDNQTNKIIFSDSLTRVYFLAGNEPLSDITITNRGIFGHSVFNIYKLIPKGKNLVPIRINVDRRYMQTYNTAIEDNQGNYIISGEKYLTAVIDGSTTMSVPIHYFADQLTKDSSGNIWVADRKDQITKFSVHPETPERYLQPERQFAAEFKYFNIRSANFDSSGSLWIGTRFIGLYKLSFDREKIFMRSFTKKDGLIDNFNAYLACDADNNLWSCSPSGVDKISFKENNLTITNVTGQNNMFGRVNKIVFRDDTAWALTEAGTIIKIKQESKTSTGYTPHLNLAYVKKGRDTIPARPFYKFSWFDNNLSFYFAATSFYQESQIQYFYHLIRNGDTTWSERSPNASISFVNLAPGNYVLQTRVSFPAGRYADQTIEIPVTIIPPWWRTNWFRFLVVAIIIALSVAGMRIYVRGKLTRQRIMLEKQQAIQKERTRIATDMHDDLGAGLSRIKFLSEMVQLKQQSQRDTAEDISRIGDYAREMIGKMGEIVWALNEKNDSVSSLVAYTRVYAAEYLTQNGLRVNIQTPETCPDIFVTGEIRRNIFLTVKEALHNIVKHAQANNVNISICVESSIVITIADNGIGIDEDNIRPFSNGITNMQKRIHEIGGTLEIKNNPGTSVCINVPIHL